MIEGLRQAEKGIIEKINLAMEIQNDQVSKKIKMFEEPESDIFKEMTFEEWTEELDRVKKFTYDMDLKITGLNYALDIVRSEILKELDKQRAII